jgi:hypothetical protein
MRIYYFGCWNQAGHYMFGPHGSRVYGPDRSVEYFGNRERHIDASLAPRRLAARVPRRFGVPGDITWLGEHHKNDYYTVQHDSDECPQGQCLVHHLDNGFTAMQWWDRTQGDTRGACNSTILLEGKHDFEACVAALREHFPTVLANLEKAGVKLVEVKP